MDSSDFTTGVMQPPPGITPNFVNPESNAQEMYIAAVVPALVVIAIYLLRVYTSWFIIKRWYLDDGFIAVALVLAVGASSIAIIQARQNGAGTHLWDVTIAQYKRLLKLGVTGSAITYNLATLFTKVSILLFYLRFPSSRGFRITTYCVMFFTVGYSLAQAFSFIYICSPVERYWDSSVGGGCVNTDMAYIVTAALNLSADLAILVLPTWLLRPLRSVGTRQKIAVMFVFMTGGFVCAVSAVRLCLGLIGLPDPDFTWRGYLTNQTWSLLEMHIGIACACMPCLTPLLKRHFPCIFSADRSENGLNLSPGAMPTPWRQISSSQSTSGFPKSDIRWQEQQLTDVGGLICLSEVTGSNPETQASSVNGSKTEREGITEQASAPSR